MLGTNDFPKSIPNDEELARLVRQTVQAASQPDPRRLRQLMPTPPKPRRMMWVMQWQRQLTAVTLGLFLLLGTVGVYRSSGWSVLPATQIAVTATQTTAPTETAEPTSTAIAAGTAVATPAPQPTPIAALPLPQAFNLNSN